MDTNSYWDHMISSQVEKYEKNLRKGKYGRSNRNLLFVIVRECLIQMTEMDRLFQLHGSVDDSVVEKLLALYGEELIIRWRCDVRHSQTYITLIRKVQKFIDKGMKNNLTDEHPQNTSLIAMLAWEKQRVCIIETIIEPYLLKRNPCGASNKSKIVASNEEHPQKTLKRAYVKKKKKNNNKDLLIKIQNYLSHSTTV